MPHERSIRFQSRYSTIARMRVPAFRFEMPSAIDVDQILLAVFLENLNPMFSHEPFAKRTNKRTVFFEYEKGVLRVVRYHVYQPVTTFSQSMRLDHRSHNRVRLGPTQINFIPQAIVPKRKTIGRRHTIAMMSMFASGSMAKPEVR